MDKRTLYIMLAGATAAQAAGIVSGTWYHEMLAKMILEEVDNG